MDSIKLPGNIWSILRHSTLTPKCCQEHKVSCSLARNINISRWKFPVQEGQSSGRKREKFDPWTRVTRLHQKRTQDMRQFDDALQQLKVQGFLRQFMLALDPAVIGKVASLLDIQLPHTSYEKVGYESLLDSMPPPSSDSSLHRYEESFMPSDMASDDEQAKESELSSRNPYLALLKRLRKKELEQKFPDQDLVSVKQAEEVLQQATMEFCQWSKTLGEVSEKERQPSEEVEEDSDANQSDKEGEAVFDVKSLRRMFYVAYGKPIHCPHIPTFVQEPYTEPEPLPDTSKTEEEKKMHIAWYLHPTVWFKKWVEESVAELPEIKMTEEEIMMAESYSVQKFIEYLEEKNLEPPRVLVELMDKQRERLSRYDPEPE